MCNECIAVLRRDLAEKDERIRYWSDCYEKALSQVSEFPDTKLSQIDTYQRIQTQAIGELLQGTDHRECIFEQSRSIGW